MLRQQGRVQDGEDRIEAALAAVSLREGGAGVAGGKPWGSVPGGAAGETAGAGPVRADDGAVRVGHRYGGAREPAGRADRGRREADLVAGGRVPGSRVAAPAFGASERADQGQRREDRGRASGHLARGAPVRAGAGDAALRLPHGTDRDVRGADRGADRRPDARGRPGRRARRRRDGREPGLRPRRAQGPGRLRQADRERQGDGRGLARDDGRRPHGDPDDRGHDRAHHRGGDRPGLLGLPVRAALQLVAGAGAGNPDQRRQVPAGALAQGRQQGGAIPAHGRHVRPQEPDVHRGQAPWAPRPEGRAGGDHGNRASLRA